MFREQYGDLFKVRTDAICITTNGFVKKSGHAVMGRGVAKQATTIWPWMSEVLGKKIDLFGNITQVVAKVDILPHLDDGLRVRSKIYVVSLPVKHAWFEGADPKLITLSIQQLISLRNTFGWRQVTLPRPGCGNGGLDWKEVRPLLTGLDDRYVVVCNER